MPQPVYIPGRPLPRTVGAAPGKQTAIAIATAAIAATIVLSIFIVYFRRARVRSRVKSQLIYIRDAKKEEDITPQDMAEGLTGLLGNYADTKVWAWTDAGRLEWAREELKTMADEIGLDVPKKVWLQASTKAMAYMQRADIGRWAASTYAGVWLTKSKKSKKTAKKARRKKAKKKQ